MLAEWIAKDPVWATNTINILYGLGMFVMMATFAEENIRTWWIRLIVCLTWPVWGAVYMVLAIALHVTRATLYCLSKLFSVEEQLSFLAKLEILVKQWAAKK